MEIKFVRINSALEAVGLLQIACEPNIDSDLGIRMWGGKDSTGEVSRWLAKNKPALVFSMRVSNLVGVGTRPAKVDAQGNIVAGSLSASDIPEHNELNGLQGGSSTERFHVTLFEKENLHPPLVLSETDGKPLALNGQELSFLFGSSLKVVNNELEVDPSNISHADLSGLESDDHTQYILANGLRAFTAPVSGVTPTLGSHLVTKDFVEMVLAGSSDFQESVLSVASSVPASPSSGARYINTTQAGLWAGFALNSIVEWNGTSWFQAWNPSTTKALGARTFIEDVAQDFRYTGSGWFAIPSISDHGQLTGLGDDDHTQYTRADGTRGFTAPVAGATPTQNAHLATKQYVDSNKVTDHSALDNLEADDHTQYVPRNGSRGFTAPVSGATPTIGNHLTTKQYVDSIIGSKYLQEGKAVVPATVVDLFETNGSASAVLFEISSAQNEPMIFGIFQQSTNYQGRIVLLTVKGEVPTFITGYYQGKIQLRAIFATTTFNMYLRASCFDGIKIAQNIVTFEEVPVAPVVVNLSSSSSDTYTLKTNSSDATPDFLEAKLEGGFGVLVEAIEEEGDDWHLKLSSKFVAGSNVVFEELPNGSIQISATGTPPSDLRVFRLQNFGANCGQGSAPSYNSPDNQLTLNENGDIQSGDKSTISNNSYANGALSPIRISKPLSKMTSLSFFGVKGRTNGSTVVAPSFVKLQLWEVQVNSSSHVLVGTYSVQVSSAYQANVQNNSGGTNSIVEGRLVGLEVVLDVAKLYGVTVAPSATWEADNSQISRIDRLIVNMEVE